MRPLSGSGSIGLLSDLVNQHGADSLIAKIGATMFGSTETTFYDLAVYFGSVGISIRIVSINWALSLVFGKIEGAFRLPLQAHQHQPSVLRHDLPI